MIFCRHRPGGALAPFVDWFWYFKDLYPPHRREHVLPEGTLELVIDLRDEPRRLFDRTEPDRHTEFRRGWLSGTHSSYIVIDAMPGASMIGVHFKAGGAAAFLGVPADELRDQVVELDAIWGGQAAELRERLLASPEPAAKFRILECFLTGLLSRHRPEEAVWQRISWALERFLDEPEMVTIGDVVHGLGISHKHFIAQFRDQVGLPPKLFCRVRRFQRALRQIHTRREVDWADLACRCGYFDQAHFANDFQTFSGLNPTRYLRHGPEDLNFVPVPDGR